MPSSLTGAPPLSGSYAESSCQGSLGNEVLISLWCRRWCSAQSGLTLCDPMDCSPPGSSVLGVSQARILERVAISSSRGSSRSRDQTCNSCISCIGRQILYHCTTWGAHICVSYRHSTYLLTCRTRALSWGPGIQSKGGIHPVLMMLPGDEADGCATKCSKPETEGTKATDCMVPFV